MDPLSAIGLVSSVITFIDFGYEVISAAREVHMSASSTTTANKHIEFLNTRMEAVASELSVAKSSGVMSADTQRLTELADKCLELSNDLKQLLEKLRAKNSKSKRQVLSSIVKNVRKKDEKKELEARLDQCRQQLHLQLSYTTRLETLNRLDEIAHTGICFGKELQSLNHQLGILKDVVTGLKPNSRLQDEARTVLELSDLAVSKVLQNNILEALRFERMESRFDSIEEAHTETFKWLLEEETPTSPIAPTGNIEDQWFASMNDVVEKDILLRLEIRKDFTKWLLHGNGIFHISGKPGAGKSTLMKYLTGSSEVKKQMKTWANGKELTFASFFFWRHGTEFQKSMQGLLQSLLYSVVDGQPNLAPMVFPTQWESARTSPGKTLHFYLSDIQKAFKILTETPEVYIRHKFAFFVDGLDEFEGHEDSLVKTLFRWAQSGSENIKICVSSRELPIFQQRFSKCPKFRLHEATYRDIFLFVYDTLRNNEDVRSLSQPHEVARLGRSLVERAEGVFLWVSLALRLVERGLVLEESIEELEGYIYRLPRELEQLFRVIFDSIKTEQDLAKRRKAMRTLSLAVDEIQVPVCKGKLFLTHLSFMTDYDHDTAFASHMRDDFNDTDRAVRLSRCRKQLGGGCRGLLTIGSNSNPNLLSWDKNPHGIVRKEIVALTHRTLIEFFQLPDVRVCIEEYTQGFDRLDFYCQSLIAELKVWPIDQEYGELEKLSIRAISRGQGTRSELLYGREWLEPELKRLIFLYYYICDSSTHTLVSTIRHLRQLMQTESELMWPFHFGYNADLVRGLVVFFGSADIAVDCQLENCIVFVTLQYGLYEFWPTTALDENSRGILLLLVATSLEDFWTGDQNQNFPGTARLFHRLLRSLATCLADGTSANSLIQGDAQPTLDTSLSVWQNIVWHSIGICNPQAPITPVWLLFLLHGADTGLTVNFEATCNFSKRNRSRKMMMITGYWGPEGYQTHLPILIEDDDEIVGLARNRNWSISLEELAYFWFPSYADSFRRVFELYEDNGHVAADGFMELRRELGLDPECWQDKTWGDAQPLLQHPWQATVEHADDTESSEKDYSVMPR